MKAEVTTTSNTMPANAALGTKEKTLHYLIIKVGEKQVVINVGDKTIKAVKEIGGK